jgi:hypothetical protein
MDNYISFKLRINTKETNLKRKIKIKIKINIIIFN